MSGKLFPLIAILLGTALRAHPATPPNLLVLVADGVGQSDLSCYQSANTTPHLDALAGAGTRFTRFMAASGLCSPSRASLLTGIYPQRFGLTGDLTGTDGHLPARATTLPELLKAAGYTSVHVGRWDLGGLRPGDLNRRTEVPGPREHGFDHYVAPIDGETPGKWVRDDQPMTAPPTARSLPETTTAREWLKTLATNDRPFFLLLGFDTAQVKSHADRVRAIDDATGEMLQELDSLGARDRTLVLFTSDAAPAEVPEGYWLKGRRGGLDNGSIRVPMLISLPGVIRAGRSVEVPMHGNDVLPTLLAAAGIMPPADLALDGLDFLPFLQGKRAAPISPSLFWRQPVAGQMTDVILHSRWKLFVRDGQPTALYNIFLDDGERNNVLQQYATNANAVPKLMNELKQWRGEMKR